MSAYVQNLIQASLGDGARATKFEVQILFPNNELFPDYNSASVLTKTAQFPGKSNDKINFLYKGRSIPIKGQVKYDQTWECTFYLSEDHSLKNAFEIWLEALEETNNSINDTSEVANLQSTQKKHYNDGDLNYTTTAYVFQRNFDDDQNTAIYELYNIFPTSISSGTYSADAVGQVLEFTVTFSYSYYTMKVIKSSETGTFIDSLIDKGVNAVTGAAQDIIGATQDALADLASDAIGASKNALENAGFDLSAKPNTSKSYTKEISQFVSSEGNMVNTIHDVVGK